MSPVALFGALVVSLAVIDEPASAEDVRATYEKARADSSRDAESQVTLALWCEARGLTKERARHLAMAALADPNHALARALMGLVKDGDAWRPAEDVARRAAADPGRTALLADYRDRRAAMKNTADDHGKLAQWCDSKGLKDEGQAHWRAVVRLDPARDAAWRKLGCKKVNGRWLTDIQVADLKAEQEAQKAADRRWEAQLATWKTALQSRNADRRAQAARDLADVTDSRAVPAVLKVFAFGMDADPKRGVQLLGQIDAPASSRALAGLVLYHDDATVRSLAGLALRNRDPREFAAPLIAALQEPIKYQVDPVGGPGSPGVLIVEGKDQNYFRRYAPPPGPIVLPGDSLGVDRDGSFYADRYVGAAVHQFTPAGLGFVANAAGGLQPGTGPLPTSANPAANQLRGFLDRAGASTANAERTLWIVASEFAGWGIPSYASSNTQLMREFAAAENIRMPLNPGSKLSYSAAQVARIPVGRMQAEAVRTAAVAGEQLKADAAAIDRRNDAIRDWNDRALKILKAVGSENTRDERASWVAWYTDLIGYAYIPEPVRRRETIYEDVPLAYEPGPVPIPVYEGGILSFSRMSCFAAGTIVQTIDGPQPIESLHVGDKVLAEDTVAGAIAYRPVLVVHRNPPSKTLAVRTRSEDIIASTFHRFWVAGRGWVLARDLKAGDALRTLRGVAPVVSVAPGEVIPVFNLDVADAATFFVGDSALLVHDNTLPDPRARPFDRGAEAVSSR